MFEALEDRICFSSTSIAAAPTLSAHELHLRHVAHVEIHHRHRSGISIQITTISRPPLLGNAALATFGNMALISGAFGTTAPATFQF